MLKKGMITKEREELVDVICDMCGKSCRAGKEPDNYEYARLLASWGYYSKKDGNDWEFDLCESCADKVGAFISKEILKAKEKKNEKITHLYFDCPPRGTACGLYYPKNLDKKGFGTYMRKEVTCKACLKAME